MPRADFAEAQACHRRRDRSNPDPGAKVLAHDSVGGTGKLGPQWEKDAGER